MNEDNFSVQLMDSNEQIHLLEKQPEVFPEEPTSLMPKYDAGLLNDKDLDDIIAYLVSGGEMRARLEAKAHRGVRRMSRRSLRILALAAALLWRPRIRSPR